MSRYNDDSRKWYNPRQPRDSGDNNRYEHRDDTYGDHYRRDTRDPYYSDRRYGREERSNPYGRGAELSHRGRRPEWTSEHHSGSRTSDREWNIHTVNSHRQADSRSVPSRYNSNKTRAEYRPSDNESESGYSRQSHVQRRRRDYNYDRSSGRYTHYQDNTPSGIQQSSQTSTRGRKTSDDYRHTSSQNEKVTFDYNHSSSQDNVNKARSYEKECSQSSDPDYKWTSENEILNTSDREHRVPNLSLGIDTEDPVSGDTCVDFQNSTCEMPTSGSNLNNEITREPGPVFRNIYSGVTEIHLDKTINVNVHQVPQDSMTDPSQLNVDNDKVSQLQDTIVNINNILCQLKTKLNPTDSGSDLNTTDTMNNTDTPSDVSLLSTEENTRENSVNKVEEKLQSIQVPKTNLSIDIVNDPVKYTNTGGHVKIPGIMSPDQDCVVDEEQGTSVSDTKHPIHHMCQSTNLFLNTDEYVKVSPKSEFDEKGVQQINDFDDVKIEKNNHTFGNDEWERKPWQKDEKGRQIPENHRNRYTEAWNRRPLNRERHNSYGHLQNDVNFKGSHTNYRQREDVHDQNQWQEETRHITKFDKQKSNKYDSRREYKQTYGDYKPNKKERKQEDNRLNWGSDITPSKNARNPNEQHTIETNVKQEQDMTDRKCLNAKGHFENNSTVTNSTYGQSSKDGECLNQGEEKKSLKSFRIPKIRKDTFELQEQCRNYKENSEYCKKKSSFSTESKRLAKSPEKANMMDKKEVKIQNSSKSPDISNKNEGKSQAVKSSTDISDKREGKSQGVKNSTDISDKKEEKSQAVKSSTDISDKKEGKSEAVKNSPDVQPNIFEKMSIEIASTKHARERKQCDKDSIQTIQKQRKSSDLCSVPTKESAIDSYEQTPLVDENKSKLGCQISAHRKEKAKIVNEQTGKDQERGQSEHAVTKPNVTTVQNVSELSENGDSNSSVDSNCSGIFGKLEHFLNKDKSKHNKENKAKSTMKSHGSEYNRAKKKGRHMQKINLSTSEDDRNAGCASQQSSYSWRSSEHHNKKLNMGVKGLKTIDGQLYWKKNKLLKPNILVRKLTMVDILNMKVEIKEKSKLPLKYQRIKMMSESKSDDNSSHEHEDPFFIPKKKATAILSDSELSLSIEDGAYMEIGSDDETLNQCLTENDVAIDEECSQSESSTSRLAIKEGKAGEEFTKEHISENKQDNAIDSLELPNKTIEKNADLPLNIGPGGAADDASPHKNKTPTSTVVCPHGKDTPVSTLSSLSQDKKELVSTVSDSHTKYKPGSVESDSHDRNYSSHNGSNSKTKPSSTSSYLQDKNKAFSSPNGLNSKDKPVSSASISRDNNSPSSVASDTHCPNKPVTTVSHSNDKSKQVITPSYSQNKTKPVSTARDSRDTKSSISNASDSCDTKRQLSTTDDTKKPNSTPSDSHDIKRSSTPSDSGNTKRPLTTISDSLYSKRLVSTTSDSDDTKRPNSSTNDSQSKRRPVCMVSVVLDDEDDEEESQSILVENASSSKITVENKLKTNFVSSSNKSKIDTDSICAKESTVMKGEQNMLRKSTMIVEVQAANTSKSESYGKSHDEDSTDDDLPTIRRPKVIPRSRVASKKSNTEFNANKTNKNSSDPIIPLKKKLFKSNTQITLAVKEESGHDGDVEDNINYDEPTQIYDEALPTTDKKSKDTDFDATQPYTLSQSENKKEENIQSKADSDTITVNTKRSESDAELVEVKEEPNWLKNGYTQEPDTIFISDDDTNDMVMSVSQPIINLCESDSETEDLKGNKAIVKEIQVNDIDDLDIHDPDYWACSSPDNDSGKSDFEVDDFFKMVSRLSEPKNMDSDEEKSETFSDNELYVFSDNDECIVESEKDVTKQNNNDHNQPSSFHGKNEDEASPSIHDQHTQLFVANFEKKGTQLSSETQVDENMPLYMQDTQVDMDSEENDSTQISALEYHSEFFSDQDSSSSETQSKHKNSNFEFALEPDVSKQQEVKHADSRPIFIEDMLEEEILESSSVSDDSDAALLDSIESVSLLSTQKYSVKNSEDCDTQSFGETVENTDATQQEDLPSYVCNSDSHQSATAMRTDDDELETQVFDLVDGKLGDYYAATQVDIEAVHTSTNNKQCTEFKKPPYNTGKNTMNDDQEGEYSMATQVDRGFIHKSHSADKARKAESTEHGSEKQTLCERSDLLDAYATQTQIDKAVESDTQAFNEAVESDTQTFNEAVESDSQTFNEAVECDTQTFNEAVDYNMLTQVDNTVKDQEYYDAPTQILTDSASNNLIGYNASTQEEILLVSGEDYIDPQYEMYFLKPSGNSSSNVNDKLGIKLDHSFRTEVSKICFPDDDLYVNEGKHAKSDDLYFVETQQDSEMTPSTNEDDNEDAYMEQTQVDNYLMCHSNKDDKNTAEDANDMYCTETQFVKEDKASSNDNKQQNQYLEQTQVDFLQNSNLDEDKNDLYLAETQCINEAVPSTSKEKHLNEYLEQTQVDFYNISESDDDLQDPYLAATQVAEYKDDSNGDNQMDELDARNEDEIGGILFTADKDEVKNNKLKLKKLGKRHFSNENQNISPVENLTSQSKNIDAEEIPPKKVKLDYVKKITNKTNILPLERQSSEGIETNKTKSLNPGRRIILIDPTESSSLDASSVPQGPPPRSKSFLDARQNIAIIDASKDDMWLSKKTLKDKGKQKAAKRKRCKSGDATLDIKARINEARIRLEERNMRFIANPDCIADPHKKLKPSTSTTSTGHCADVDYPSLSQVITKGYPILETAMLHQPKPTTESVQDFPTEVTTSNSTMVTSTVSTSVGTVSTTLSSNVHGSITTPSVFTRSVSNHDSINPSSRDDEHKSNSKDKSSESVRSENKKSSKDKSEHRESDKEKDKKQKSDKQRGKKHGSDKVKHVSDKEKGKKDGNSKDRDHKHVNDKDREHKHVSDKEREKKHVSDKEREQKHGNDKNREKKHVSDKDKEKKHVSDKDKEKKHVSDKDREKKHASDKDKEKKHVSDKDREKKHVSDKDREKKHVSDKDKEKKKHVSDKDREKKHVSDKDREKKHASDNPGDHKPQTDKVRGHDNEQDHKHLNDKVKEHKDEKSRTSYESSEKSKTVKACHSTVDEMSEESGSGQSRCQSLTIKGSDQKLGKTKNKKKQDKDKTANELNSAETEENQDEISKHETIDISKSSDVMAHSNNKNNDHFSTVSSGTKDKQSVHKAHTSEGQKQDSGIQKPFRKQTWSNTEKSVINEAWVSIRKPNESSTKIMNIKLPPSDLDRIPDGVGQTTSLVTPSDKQSEITAGVKQPFRDLQNINNMKPVESNSKKAAHKTIVNETQVSISTSAVSSTYKGKTNKPPSVLSSSINKVGSRKKFRVTWSDTTLHASNTSQEAQNRSLIYPSTSTENLMRKIPYGQPVAPVQTVSFPPDLMKLNNPVVWEKIITVILRWNPTWFEERDKMENEGVKKCAPPPVTEHLDSNGLFPLVDRYSSLEEYTNKFMLPLLMHETWQSIYTDWREKKNKGQLHKLKLLTNQYGNYGDKLQEYSLIGLVTREEKKCWGCLNEGDLINLKMYGKPKKSENIQSVYRDIMGVVVNVMYKDSRPVVDRICNQNAQLAKLRRPDSAQVMLTVRVRWRTFVPSNRPEDPLTEIQPLSSIVCIKRQIDALSFFPNSPLCRDLLYPNANCTYSDRAVPSLPHDRKKLNESQSLAVNTAVRVVIHVPATVPRICLLQGPPGTGKSYTIINIIRRIVQEKHGKCRICLTAPSHAAVDELLRKINRMNSETANKQAKVNIVRLGKKHSVHPDIQRYCLDNLVQEKLKGNIPQSLQAERSTLETKITTVMKNIKDSKDKYQVQKWTIDLNKLRKDKENLDAKFQIDMNQVNPGMEKKTKWAILTGAHVIAGTLSSMGGYLLKMFLPKTNTFDCIIVDEATQATELDTLIPLQYGTSKLILVGDPEQLSPTVLSKVAQENKLNMSLFQRLDNHFRYSVVSSRQVIFLDTQYRMNTEIASFPNSYIYEGRLKSNTEQMKCDLVPYLLFDIREGEEQFSQGSRSMSNQMEAIFTAELCKFILKETKFPEKSIGIIAPYSKQKAEVLKKLAGRGLHRIEVSTVDGFQGREKNIIMMSCVRAVSGSLGFVGNRNRMNVALTRAKYAMYLVGHFGALRSSGEWQALIDDAKQRDKIVSVSTDTYCKNIKSCLKRNSMS